MMDRVGNGLFSVNDLHLFSVGLADSDLNIIDNILWFLKAWIIRSNDRQVCKLSADLSHFKASEF